MRCLSESSQWLCREQPPMSELWCLSASEVARLVRTRKVSAREMADAALQRLDSVNPRINAIVDCRPDLVREQADQVDGPRKRRTLEISLTVPSPHSTLRSMPT